MLALTDTIYGAGVNDGQSIDDLLRLPDRTAVERHLLSAFLAYAYQPVRSGKTWSRWQAERWLGLIGALSARFLGLITGVAIGLGLLVTIALLGVTHHVFGARLPLWPSIGSLAAVSLVPAVVAGVLVGGINSGWLVFLPLIVPQLVVEGLTAPPLSAALLGAAFSVSPAELRHELRAELISRRQGKGSSAANPREDLVRSRGRALVVAATAGAMLSVLAIALTLVGAHVPRDAAVVFIGFCMVVFMLCAPWGSFQLARAWFALRRQLPYRMLDFLDDAHERAVLRTAGPRLSSGTTRSLGTSAIRPGSPKSGRRSRN